MAKKQVSKPAKEAPKPAKKAKIWQSPVYCRELGLIKAGDPVEEEHEQIFKKSFIDQYAS